MKIILKSLLLCFAMSCCQPFETLADVCEGVKVRNREGNYIVPGALGDIIYRRVNGIDLSLDAYIQKRGDHLPAVIVIHGGNWDSGSRIAFVGQFLETLTRAGYNWFSVDYRLGGVAKYEEALDDLRSALAFIRCNSKQFRIDPERIILLGEDTGAHLAAMLTTEKPPGVKLAVFVGGIYDLGEISHLKSQIASAEWLAQASPTAHITNGMPTTLVIHGTADREVPAQQAIRFCDAVRALGGKCDYIGVEDAIHRPENWLPRQWRYKKSMIEWLGKRIQYRNIVNQPYQTRLKKDILFNRQSGLKLDAYLPAGRGPFSAVIIAHGGGWEAGDKVTYATPVFEPLAKAGFAWFSIDYRLTPQSRHEDQLQDLRDAIEFIRHKAKHFRIDPDRIAILGESASGQMVAQLATEKPAGVAAVVSFYGVYDFNALVTDWSPRSIPARLFGFSALDDRAREVMGRFSPIRSAHKGMPPVLLICGTKDRLHAQHIALAAKLKQIGAPFTQISVDSAPHGIENWEGHAEWMSYKTRLIEWLKSNLNGKTF